MRGNQLSNLAIRRLRRTEIGIRCLEESSEIVVFGSRSVGLERTESDLDVLCIGYWDCKLKTSYLDLSALHIKNANELTWLGSELASHIAKYGTWIKGSPQWIDGVYISPATIDAKRRRLAAFFRALPDRWSDLDEEFRRKYTTKLRREAQRLLLLEHDIPIPPTRLLDESWKAFSLSTRDIRDCLTRFFKCNSNGFEKDLLDRVLLSIETQDYVKGTDRVQIGAEFSKRQPIWLAP